MVVMPKVGVADLCLWEMWPEFYIATPSAFLTDNSFSHDT